MHPIAIYCVVWCTGLLVSAFFGGPIPGPEFSTLSTILLGVFFGLMQYVIESVARSINTKEE